jgi:hypothetical protein
MKTITREISNTSSLENISWSDDSIFSNTIEGYKKEGFTLEELCKDLYERCLPEWAENNEEEFEPEYTVEELIEHLRPEWNVKKRKSLADRMTAQAKKNGYTITIQNACEWKTGAKGWDFSIINSLGCWEEPEIKEGQNKSLTDIHFELCEEEII